MKRQPRWLISVSGICAAITIAGVYWKKSRESGNQPMTLPIQRSTGNRPSSSKAATTSGILTPAEQQQWRRSTPIQALLTSLKSEYSESLHAERSTLLDTLTAEEFRLLLLEMSTDEEQEGYLHDFFCVMARRFPDECCNLLSEIKSDHWFQQKCALYCMPRIAVSKPEAAIAWLEAHPNFFTTEPSTFQSTQILALGGVARYHSSLAFETAKRWELDGNDQVIETLFSSPETFEMKASAFEEGCRQCDSISDPDAAAAFRQKIVAGLAAGLGTDWDACYSDVHVPANLSFQFESIITWLDSLHLSDEERIDFANGFPGPDDLKEAQKWDEWAQSQGYDRLVARMKILERGY